MSYSTAAYFEADPILNAWADRHGLEWIRDDRGWDVRTLYWQLAHPESVQLWVDEPVNGSVTVHVCHNTTKGGHRHSQVQVIISELEPVLDDSFNTARSLADELKRNINAPNN